MRRRLSESRCGVKHRGNAELAVGSRWRRLQENVEIVGMNGTEQGIFAVDVIVVDQGDQRIFQAERSLFLGHGYFLVEVLECVAADVMAGAVADHEEFGGGNAAAGFLGKQDLRVNRGEGHG